MAYTPIESPSVLMLVAPMGTNMSSSAMLPPIPPSLVISSLLLIDLTPLAHYCIIAFLSRPAYMFDGLNNDS